MKFKSRVVPKNSNKLIITGTLNEVKLLTGKIFKGRELKSLIVD